MPEWIFIILLASVSAMFNNPILNVVRRGKDLSAMSDEDLIGSFKKRNNWDVIIELMKRNSDIVAAQSISRLKNTEDAKDFANEILIQVFEKLKTQDVKRFRPWLSTMVRNRLHDLYRKKQVRTDYAINERNKPVQLAHTDERKLDMDFLAEKLNQLTAEEKTCLTLIYLDGNAYKDVMAMQNWTFNQLRGFRTRGLKKMRIALGPEFNHYFNPA